MNKLIFSSIFIKEENYKEYIYESGKEYLDNLSQINIFIGMNNSGKSRFIRKIFSDEDIKFLSDILDISLVNGLLKKFISEFDILRKNRDAIYFTQVEEYLNKLRNIEYKYLIRSVNYNMMLVEFQRIINWFKKLQILHIDSIEQRGKDLVTGTYNELLQLLPKDDGVTIYKFDNIYIPTLRGLRPIQTTSSNKDYFDIKNDNYFHRTFSDYFKGKENYKEKIYTGLNLYEDLQKYSHGNPTEREQLKKFQNFLSETFFHNEDVELIPAYEKDVINVKIGKFEAPIYNLGDGIQSLIILIYPLFFNQQKNLKVYIEEPELHLHPGYQKTFIETLFKPEFKNFQYFITTHSNHFLDITLDKSNISIYTFEKKAVNSNDFNFLIKNVSNSDLNILSLIGVQNSSVFLSNCTIWVEGITDRIYFRKYLEIIQQDKVEKFKEDTHFSFVEFGGNNIVHWSFLDSEDVNHSNILVDRLCGKLFLIIDSDGAGLSVDGAVLKRNLKKAKRHLQLKQKLGKQFYCLKCREIENLLTPNVLINVLSTNAKNITITETLQYEEYRFEYLGEFIDQRFKNSLRKSYSSDSGTIINKVKFAKDSIKFIESKKDMSKEAIDIAEKLYKFIKSQNEK